MNKEENIPEEKPNEINSLQEPIHESPQNENMEVHKHPHHVTHKKKWGEYVLEFLMLFLAVFLALLINQNEKTLVFCATQEHACNQGSNQSI